MQKALAVSLALLILANLPPLPARAQNREQTVCTRFHTPFNDRNRRSYQTLLARCFSDYGAYRSTNVPGHKHAGIDLRGKTGELVFSIGFGQVESVLWQFPNRGLAIRHPLPGGGCVYSLYVHVEGVLVKSGDWVDENTIVARLFDTAEFKRSQFKAVHLHLEIRKSMDDGGRASYTAMTMDELNRYCLDPKKFFAGVLEK